MNALRFILAIGLTASASSFAQPLSSQTASVPASCPVTRRPEHEFIPSAPYVPNTYKDMFYWGTDKLWISLHDPEIWLFVPHEPGHEKEAQPLNDKLFWSRVGYKPGSEPYPDLKVTGRRLDGSAPPLIATWATNGMGHMLTGVWVPAPGCWEITGDYRGDRLSFVVWVAWEQKQKPDDAQ
jgi:hypothetical protein